jgi:hypothetical protein
MHYIGNYTSSISFKAHDVLEAESAYIIREAIKSDHLGPLEKGNLSLRTNETVR